MYVPASTGNVSAHQATLYVVRGSGLLSAILYGTRTHKGHAEDVTALMHEQERVATCRQMNFSNNPPNIWVGFCKQGVAAGFAAGSVFGDFFSGANQSVLIAILRGQARIIVIRLIRSVYDTNDRRVFPSLRLVLGDARAVISLSPDLSLDFSLDVV
jgi:hypothetical protein